MGIKYGRVEEGREFRFRGDLYSQEITFPLVLFCFGDEICDDVPLLN